MKATICEDIEKDGEFNDALKKRRDILKINVLFVQNSIRNFSKLTSQQQKPQMQPHRRCQLVIK